MKKILIPIDFSEVSMNAFKYALKIAQKLKWSVEVLHIYKFPIIDPYMPVSILESLASDKQDQAVANFTNYVKSISEENHDILDDIYLNFHLQMGFAADEIITFARELRPDMIVMGTTGASSKIKAMFLGSIAGEVMEKAPCPVLAIPENAIFDGNIERIGMPIEFDEENASALVYIAELAKELEAKVACFHVDIGHKEQYTHNMEKVSNQLEWNKDMHFEVIDGIVLLDEIEQYAKKNDIEVIAMLTHKRGFFKELFHMSHAKQLSYNTSIPILGMPANLFT